MTRNLKALGLAFLAVFAMSAIAAASAAHATEFFHSHKEKTIVTADNKHAPDHNTPHILELTPTLKVECELAEFKGTEVGTASGTTWTTETLTVTPTYTKCKPFLGHAVTVDSNECHYKLFAATTETVAGKPHGNVEIICPTGKTIDITIAGLTAVIHIGSQLVEHAYNSVNVNTEGGTENEEITITATAPKVVWTCTPKAECLAALGTNGGNATYSGKVTAKGFIDGNSEPSKAGETEKYVYEEGARTGIWKGPLK